MKVRPILLILSFCVVLSRADAAPLTNAITYGAQHTDAFRNGTPGMIMVKGTTDNNAYMLEADPTTGALPVSGTITATNPSVSTTGAAVPGSATYAGMNVGGNLTGLTGTSNGLKVDGSAVTQPVSAASLPLPTGAATEATLSNVLTEETAINGKIANNYGVATGAIRTAAQIGNASGIADFNSGAGGSATLRVSAASRTKGDLARLSYGSTNVTTSAYVQLIASTAAAINRLYVFDSSGSAMIIATGASGFEVDQLYVPPGGAPYPFELNIPSGTRVSLKALDVDATSGQIIVTGLN